MSIIDLTMDIASGMKTCKTAWHSDVKVEVMGSIQEVGRNTRRIVLGSHSGTHMDAPLHFMEGGIGIDQLNLEAMCGDVNILDLSYCGPRTVVTPDMLDENLLSERILLKYGWYTMWETAEYYEGFPILSIEAAQKIVHAGVKFIAMDTPSLDSARAIQEKDDSPVHKYFFKHNVIIVEYLTNTDAINRHKQYEIFALPLKVAGSDGAPCRVILREK